MNLGEGQIKAQQLVTADGARLECSDIAAFPSPTSPSPACFMCSQAEQEGGAEEQHTPQKRISAPFSQVWMGAAPPAACGLLPACSGCRANPSLLSVVL